MQECNPVKNALLLSLHSARPATTLEKSAFFRRPYMMFRCSVRFPYTKIISGLSNGDTVSERERERERERDGVLRYYLDEFCGSQF
jgi:hypothetical protein